MGLSEGSPSYSQAHVGCCVPGATPVIMEMVISCPPHLRLRVSLLIMELVPLFSEPHEG